jgi:hypothetical protein
MRDVTPILGSPARATLSQFLAICPTCQRHCAVHVDESADDGPLIVRVICGDSCAPDLSALVELLATRRGLGAFLTTDESGAVA